MTQTQLFKFTCSSTRSGIYLSAYASTIVYSPLPGDKEAYTRGNLIAIHFGGEPSIVQALCTLIASGMPLQVTAPAKSAISENNYWIQWICGSNSILGPGGKNRVRREEKRSGGKLFCHPYQRTAFLFLHSCRR